VFVIVGKRRRCRARRRDKSAGSCVLRSRSSGVEIGAIDVHGYRGPREVEQRGCAVNCDQRHGNAGDFGRRGGHKSGNGPCCPARIRAATIRRRSRAVRPRTRRARWCTARRAAIDARAVLRERRDAQIVGRIGATPSTYTSSGVKTPNRSSFLRDRRSPKARGDAQGAILNPTR